MTAKDYSRERAALSSFVNGNTLALGSLTAGQIQGATLVPGVYDELVAYPENSVLAIVSLFGLETVGDLWKCLAEWRRVLADGGTLALVCAESGYTDPASPAWRQTFTSNGIVRLLRLAGFELSRHEVVTPGSSFLVAAKKTALARVRGTLGTFGPELAVAACESEACRGELYFHFGTILLQSGDPVLAERCFKSMLGIEPGNADGIFGLGMCYGTQQLWPEALTEFQRAVALDPNNAEARRWLALAKDKVGGKTLPGPRPVVAGLRV